MENTKTQRRERDTTRVTLIECNGERTMTDDGVPLGRTDDPAGDAGGARQLG